MSLAQRLWDINGDLGARIRIHDFVEGLGNGSLPVESFKRYVAQDAYFLEAFARAYAFCLANGTSRDDLYDFSELIAGVVEELKLHKSYTERLQIDLAGVTPIAATKFYVEFLMNTARRGRLGETIAAMTPCMRLYAWLGQSLARTNVAPTYADWVKAYSDPGFEALAVRLEALLDKHASDTPAVRANYRRAMELELGFFSANL
ncbi:MAG: TenA family protein [Rhodospirillales bacterium]|nr:TenA family protein [Rhodospirillales bacterium]